MVTFLGCLRGYVVVVALARELPFPGERAPASRHEQIADFHPDRSMARAPPVRLAGLTYLCQVIR